MNTVIRSPNWIGDGIMALPAIRAFREYFPDDSLTVVVKQYLVDIFLNIAEIDQVITIPDRWSTGGYVASLRQIRDRRFRRGILFTNSFSSALFFRLAGISDLCGYDLDARGWLLKNKIANAEQNNHHQFFYLNIIERLAGRKISRRFPATLVISAAEKSHGRGYADRPGDRRGCRFAGCRSGRRIWQRQNLAARTISRSDHDVAEIAPGYGNHNARHPGRKGQDRQDHSRRAGAHP